MIRQLDVHVQKLNLDANLKTFTKLFRKDHIPRCKILNYKISKRKHRRKSVTLDLVVSFQIENQNHNM